MVAQAEDPACTEIDASEYEPSEAGDASMRGETVLRRSCAVVLASRLFTNYVRPPLTPPNRPAMYPLL